MAEFSIDRFVDRYARRAAGMTASEVRALFAVAAARPEVVSLAGGMPFVQALPTAEVLAVGNEVLGEMGDVALQYGSGQGASALRERMALLMAEEEVHADPEDVVVTTGAQQALDLLGKLFIDPGDLIAVEVPAYVGALTAFGETSRGTSRSTSTGTGCWSTRPSRPSSAASDRSSYTRCQTSPIPPV